MEALSPITTPQTSSLKSSTPLTKSFNINVLPPTILPPTANTYNTLPPINTFPNWNRTNLTNKKLSHRITKDDKVKLQFIGNLNQIEQYTQTSPPKAISRLSNQNSINTDNKNTNNVNENPLNKLNAQIFEKKILFLQTNHSETLSQLHREVESLKNQNKALQFQLVSSGETTDFINKHARNGKDVPNNNDVEKVLELEKEINSLKENLQKEQEKNSLLTKKLEHKKERSLSALISPSKRNVSIKPSLSTNFTKATRSISAKHSTNSLQNTSEKYDYKDRMKHLKMLANTQQNELENLRDKLQHQNIHQRNFVLPSIIASSRLNLHNNSELQHQKEVLTLPILQSLPGNRNLALRKKRAKALHVQRQKSNKNMNLTLLGIKQ